MMVSGGPFPHFLSRQEVSTPWSACTAAGQQRGSCSRTHCHTWKGRNIGLNASRWIRKTFFYKGVRESETHQEMSLTKLSLREMPAPASKMEE